MQQRKIKTIIFLVLSFLNVNTQAEPVMDHPSKGVINLPINWEDGHLKISMPKGPPSKKVRAVAKCKIPNFNVEVIKSGKKLRANIRENKDGFESQRVFKYVYGKTLRKEMLGQYQVAVDVAQQLGITQVDYIKIWLVDFEQKDAKVLIFFYDSDDDLIDRTILIGKEWERCAEDLTCEEP